MTSPRYGWKPIPLLIEELNWHLRGWKNYFSQGYPRVAFREINSYVRQRLTADGNRAREDSLVALRVGKTVAGAAGLGRAGDGVHGEGVRS